MRHVHPQYLRHHQEQHIVEQPPYYGKNIHINEKVIHVLR